jgi:hypothetical protein
MGAHAQHSDTPREVGAIGDNPAAYAQRYGLLSGAFLRIYRAGELPDAPDFAARAGLCAEHGIEPAPPRGAKLPGSPPSRSPPPQPLQITMVKCPTMGPETRVGRLGSGRRRKRWSLAKRKSPSSS